MTLKLLFWNFVTSQVFSPFTTEFSIGGFSNKQKFYIGDVVSPGVDCVSRAFLDVHYFGRDW